MTSRDYIPAMGRFPALRLYDSIISLTREGTWRDLVVRHADPRPADVIVDVGCGTGSQIQRLHRAQPQARIIGIDPDPAALDLARRKNRNTGESVEWHTGMGDTLTATIEPESATTVISSLVLHQCPMPMKRAILSSMYQVLRPGGRLVIADFGLQRTPLMRLAFRVVQLADGTENTRPNADGVLPQLITEAGFRDVRETASLLTPGGSISMYTAHRP